MRAETSRAHGGGPVSQISSYGNICDYHRRKYRRLFKHKYTCWWCGKPYEAVRCTAMTCSPRCRQAAWRARQEARKAGRVFQWPNRSGRTFC